MSHYLANDPATIWPENMFFEDSEVKGAYWCREEIVRFPRTSVRKSQQLGRLLANHSNLQEWWPKAVRTDQALSAQRSARSYSESREF